MSNETSYNRIMKLLKPIMFEVEPIPTSAITHGVARLPKDRQWSIACWPDGKTDKEGNEIYPEIPYMGGEKYIIVENREVLQPLTEVLCEKNKNMRVEVINIDNEYFSVNFYEVEPDKIKNEYLTPVVTFVNSYNGKVKARATAGLLRVMPNGERMFLNTGSVFFEYKHHADSGRFMHQIITKQVDEMMNEFSTVQKKIEKLKKFDVPVSGISNFMLEIMPDSKKFPKEAINLAVEHVGMELELFEQKPNLWLVYTALATSVKKLDSKMLMHDRERADSLAWANILNHANIK